VEFSSPFKKMPSVGDKLQILAIHEGAYVKIPKLTTLTFG